jgi:hypothetical protein
MTQEELQLIKVGAEAVLKPFANLMERLFGGAVDQIGGGWEDALSTRRRIRQIGLFKKLQKAFEEAGITPRQISDNISVPALLNASLVDDETMQTKWANLLANAADPREIKEVMASVCQSRFIAPCWTRNFVSWRLAYSWG